MKLAMNPGSIADRRGQPLWAGCEPDIQNVVRRIGLRHEYDKPAIATALQRVLSGLGNEHGDLWSPGVIRKILASFGIDRVRVDGDWLLDDKPCVITFTHFYSVLDILLLFHALGERIGTENLVACGRANTLRRLEMGGRNFYEQFGERVIEFRQEHQGGPIVDLRATTQMISGRLAQGKTVMLSCTPGTQPLDIGLDRREVSIADAGYGFAYFAARGAVPVYSAAILIRPYREAVVSLDGPFPVPQLGYAHICEFAKGVISSLEMRVTRLIAEEQHWTRVPS